MANYYVGDTIRDYFTVLDSNDVPIPGLSITYYLLSVSSSDSLSCQDGGNRIMP